MEKTLAKIMHECRNYFVAETIRGEFAISNGVLALHPTPLLGSHIRLKGSVLHDGVYKVNDGLVTLSGATNEVYTGYVCYLAVPLDFIDLAGEIEAYNNALAGKPSFGLLKSESFAGYSYSLASGSNGQVASWKEVFATRLGNYRKMFEERVV